MMRSVRVYGADRIYLTDHGTLRYLSSGTCSVMAPRGTIVPIRLPFILSGSKAPSARGYMSLCTRWACEEMGTVRRYTQSAAYSILTRAPSVPGENTNIQLLEEIVSDQRTILSDVYNISDVTTIPQAWCLCTYSRSRRRAR